MGVTPKPFIGGGYIKDDEIHIRIDKKDKLKILEKAKQSKMKLSEYMITSSLEQNIIVEADKQN